MASLLIRMAINFIRCCGLRAAALVGIQPSAMINVAIASTALAGAIVHRSAGLREATFAKMLSMR